MKLTVKQIMETKPCNGYSFSFSRDVWNGKDSLSLAEIAILNIDPSDRLWIFIELMDERQCRIFSCDCSERVLPIFERDYPDEQGPRRAINLTRQFVQSETTATFTRDSALTAVFTAASAARDAARVATRDYAWASAFAAWTAAFAAAGVTDRITAAARSATKNAAWIVTKNAANADWADADVTDEITANNAWAAAWKWQLLHAVEILETK